MASKAVDDGAKIILGPVYAEEANAAGVAVASAGISVFAAGYFRAGEGTLPGLLCLQYHVFLSSMVMVMLADDAYLFMVAWETMALSSYFLVTTSHRIAEIRRAIRSRLTMGIADGSVFLDGEKIYTAKDMKVGLKKLTA